MTVSIQTYVEVKSTQMAVFSIHTTSYLPIPSELFNSFMDSLPLQRIPPTHCGCFISHKNEELMKCRRN